MAEGKWRRWRGARWVAVLVAGMLAGTVMLTPVGAHLNTPLTFTHLKKHFYTKKGANSAFVNVGETATAAANATNAANADKLDGKDSTAFGQLATVTGYASCPGHGFYPRESADAWASSLARRYPPAGDGTAFFECAVQLPHNARMKAVRWHVRDVDAGADKRVVQCDLFRSSLSGTDDDNQIAVESGIPDATNLTPGLYVIQDTSISEPIVDNSAYAYWFSCWLNSTSASVALIGASVEYTIVDVPTAVPS